MKLKTTGVIALTLLLSMTVLTFNLRPTQASPETTLYVDPTETKVNFGKSFTININIENVVDLFSYETKLGFNKTILEPITIEEGPFIKDQTTSPIGTFFLPIIKEDYVYVACVTQGNYPGVSGSGTLFTVTFNTSDTGESNLPLYDSILLNPSVTEMPHKTIDGTVLVTVVGDVNGDGVVNVIDLSIVSLSYGTFEGEPDYNPEADLNEDGVVDMRDLTIVAMHLGQPDT